MMLTAEQIAKRYPTAVIAINKRTLHRWDCQKDALEDCVVHPIQDKVEIAVHFGLHFYTGQFWKSPLPYAICKECGKGCKEPTSTCERLTLIRIYLKEFLDGEVTI